MYSSRNTVLVFEGTQFLCLMTGLCGRRPAMLCCHRCVHGRGNEKRWMFVDGCHWGLDVVSTASWSC
jgi:hypothetical protein